jgi:glycosyltransferase involved in cell wall biosynthesis
MQNIKSARSLGSEKTLSSIAVSIDTLKKPSVTIVIPAYNEEAIVKKNLGVFYRYMVGLQDTYDWEILLINDGSKDRTGSLAGELAHKNPNLKVIHHIVNMNLGNALKTGFANASGDYTITMDIDLSYAPWHIEKILDTLVSTQAEVVVASAYMKGGQVTGVPFMRRKMSRIVNSFMRLASQQNYHTFTGMVRGYRTDYIKNLNIKSTDYEINPEILYKSMILRARIIEIPAHLDWTEQNKVANKRSSNLKVFRGVLSGLMSCYIFRPYVFFLAVGVILFLVSSYIIAWIFINTFRVYPEITPMTDIFADKFSQAVGLTFQRRPHSFFVGGISLIISLIFFAIGFLSLQNKRYFEELFHLNTNVLRKYK